MNPHAPTTDVLLGIVPIVLLVALWQAISSFGYAPVTLLPPPGLVFMRLVQQLFTGGFQQEIGATLFRLFTGFSIAVVLGVTIGLAAAASPAINAVVRPIVRVLAPLPKVALYPALLLLLGFGHESKITLVAADALFPILLSTYYGASMVEQKLIWSAMAAGTPRGQILFKVVLPAAVPSRDLLHRGVSRRDDHLDRWPRPSPGDSGANLSGCRHVRAADHHLAAGPHS
jgi:NitT/TauT family transport system permease protein